MTEFQRLSKNALQEHIRTVGGVAFTFRGIQYTGTRTELTEEERVSVGQVIRDAVATLLFPFEVFTPAIRNGEKVTFTAQPGVKGETLRIGHIEINRLAIKLTLQDRQS